MSIHAAVLIVIVMQGLGLCYAVAARNHRVRGRFYLIGILLSAVYFQIFSFIADTGHLLNYIGFLKIWYPLIFLIGPLIYGYVHTVTSVTEKVEWAGDGRHLILPALSAVFAVGVHFWNRYSGLSIREFLVRPEVIAVFVGLSLLHTAVYLVFSFQDIQRYRKDLHGHIASLRGLSLNWLKTLFAVIFIIWAASLWFNVVRWQQDDSSIVSAVYCLALYALIVFALRHSYVFNVYSDLIQPPAGSTENGRRNSYEYSPLDEEGIDRISRKLEAWFREEKPYLNPDLRVSDVAAGIGVPSYQVSQVLNQRFNQNFYDYVNLHRINAAKEMLGSPTQDQPKVLAVAFEVGFNSKSSFNAAFKRYTNMTPTQYRSSLLSAT